MGLRESRAKTDAGLVRQTLKVKPYVAKKALVIAQKLDERSLHQVLTAMVDAELAMKTGRDDQWALEALVLELAGTFTPRLVGS